jgi:hypothetical protein
MFVRLVWRDVRGPRQAGNCKSFLDQRDRYVCSKRPVDLAGGAEFIMDVPLATLQPGSHLLRIRCTSGSATVVGQLRFEIE